MIRDMGGRRFKIRSGIVRSGVFFLAAFVLPAFAQQDTPMTQKPDTQIDPVKSAPPAKAKKPGPQNEPMAFPVDLKMEDNIVYKTVGDQHLVLTMFYPQVKKYDKAPVFIYIHGGGWSGGTRFNLMRAGGIDIVRNLNQAGIICAAIEYRLIGDKAGSTTYDSAADCKDAIHFLVKEATRFGIDPDRIGTFGGSAGGHLSLVTALGADKDYPCDPELAKYPGKVRVEVAYFPLVSLVDPALIKGGLLEKDPARLPAMLGGTLDAKRDIAEKLSPTLLVKADSPPIFLAHGDQDRLLSDVNSITLADICKKKGVPVECLIVKNGGHGFGATPGVVMDPPVAGIVKQVTDFVLKYLPLPPTGA